VRASETRKTNENPDWTMRLYAFPTSTKFACSAVFQPLLQRSHWIDRDSVVLKVQRKQCMKEMKLSEWEVSPAQRRTRIKRLGPAKGWMKCCCDAYTPALKCGDNDLAIEVWEHA
jgi:hypothetical protein